MRKPNMPALPVARPLGWVTTSAVVALAISLFASARGADIVRVEEDWELVVAVPAPARFAPQITTTMSPIGHLGTVRALFTLNLRNRTPDRAGGMRLQVWIRTSPVIAKRSHVGTLLHYSNETITWTQVMSLDRGTLRFAVIHGDSETWGPFGGHGSLAVPVETGLVNLNRYYHGASAVNSGVSGIALAPTRVRSLTLGTIRKYSRHKLESQDTTRTIVYAH